MHFPNALYQIDQFFPQDKTKYKRERSNCEKMEVETTGHLYIILKAHNFINDISIFTGPER